MKRCILITILVALAVAFSAPKAEAMDPVTIAILAPIALKVADAAKPYIIRGLLNAGKCMLKMGKDVLEIFYLPFGLMEMTFGAPFGFFKSGFVHLIKGGIAPCKLVVHTLLLPVMMFGVNVNI